MGVLLSRSSQGSGFSMQGLEVTGFQDSGTYPLYPFGPLNHGIWALIKVFGTQNLRLQT